jgi:hypothetical protein
LDGRPAPAFEIGGPDSDLRRLVKAVAAAAALGRRES